MVVVLCVGSLVPVAYVVQAAFSFGADALFALMFRPRMGELLTNTVLVLLLSVPCTIVLGVAGAWCVERTRLPARRVFAVLLAAPLAIPAFVSSYAWGSTFGWVEGLGGAVLVSVSAYTPLVYLPVLAALRGLDPAGEEAARSLGLGPWRVFTRVVMPHLRLAMLGGALVVALHLLAEYGAFAFLRFETFTTAIVVAYQSTFAGPNPAALGIVLTGLCLLVLAGESVARGHRRYARVGSGSPHPPTLASLGRAAVPTLILMTTFIGVAVVFPLLVVVRWLAAWDSAPLDRMLAAVQGTVTLSLLGAVATVLVALPVVWFAARYPSGASRRLEAAMSVSSSLPVIIVALSLVTLTVRLAPALYQTAFTVVAAYVIVFLPRALVSLRAGIAQVPESYEEVARSLGSSPLRSRVRVTLPLLLPSIGAAVALVALGAANELTATLLLAPTGTRTVATEFWSAAAAIDYAGAAPYALLLVVISVPAAALLFTEATRKRRIR